MNNNGLIEYKESFIVKIRNFFRRVFGKKEEAFNDTQEGTIEEIKQESNDFQNNFIEDIKVNAQAVNAVFEKEEFLKEIDGNEAALKMLSIDRLKKLEKYYDSIIEQNNEKIKKLKASA